MNTHMKSMDEQYNALKELAKVAKGRTSDEVLLGIIDYLIQLTKALMEKNENLKELHARDASDKYGSSSETLDGLSGKMESLCRKARELKAQAESSGETSAREAEDAREAEERQRQKAELLEKVRQLDREEAERQARQEGPPNPPGMTARRWSARFLRIKGSVRDAERN